MIVRLTPDTRDRIKAMLAYGAKRRAIAKATGYSTATVTNVMRGRREVIAIAHRPVEEILGPRQKGGPDPTPDEITAACEAIRRVREQEDLMIVKAEAAFRSRRSGSKRGGL